MSERGRQRLQAELQALAQELGDTPTQADVNQHTDRSHSTYVRAFGGWNDALEAAGLTVNQTKNKARVEFECDNPGCSGTVAKLPAEVEQSDRHYCSQECHYEHKSELYNGDGNPQSTLVTVECANCGDELQRPQWKRENNERHFCDYECMGEWRQGRFEGDGHPQWVDYPVKECEVCGVEFKSRPSLNQRFCSRRCKHQWQSQLTGEDNPQYNRITKKCNYCGDEYDVKPSEADGSKYCSASCRMSDRTGEDHPRYNPDKLELYYGHNWREQRTKRIIADQARCTECGMTEREHLQRYGRGLDVHHITPLNEYGDSREEIDYEQANALPNLTTLCRGCHRRLEP